MPKEVHIRFYRHRCLELPTINTTQPIGNELHDDNRTKGCHEGLQPIRILATENVVHEELGKERRGQSHQSGQKTDHKEIEQGSTRVTHSPTDKA